MKKGRLSTGLILFKRCKSVKLIDTKKRGNKRVRFKERINIGNSI